MATDNDQLGRRVQLGWLAAFYGGLLTEGQRQVLSLYCEEDMSLAEIAQELGISRQAVHDQLHRAAEKLDEWERQLRVAARFQEMEDGLAALQQLLQEGKQAEALQLIQALLRQQDGGSSNETSL